LAAAENQVRRTIASAMIGAISLSTERVKIVAHLYQMEFGGRGLQRALGGIHAITGTSRYSSISVSAARQTQAGLGAEPHTPVDVAVSQLLDRPRAGR
jgi:hypothetical protein